MSSELNLRFPDEAHVLVSLNGEESRRLLFASPVTAQDRRDLVWYLEMYGAHSLGNPDDAEAVRIAGRLPELGKALFDAVFQGPVLRLFQRFQDQQESARLLAQLRRFSRGIPGEPVSCIKEMRRLARTPIPVGFHVLPDPPDGPHRQGIPSATG